MRIVTVAAIPQYRSNVQVCVNVKDYGARGDGVTVDRDAIQRAIDAASPGCTVLFPRGTYYLGDYFHDPLSISKSLKIFLDEGATIKGTNLFNLSGSASDISFEGVGESSKLEASIGFPNNCRPFATPSGAIRSFSVRRLVITGENIAGFTVAVTNATVWEDVGFSATGYYRYLGLSGSPVSLTRVNGNVFFITDPVGDVIVQDCQMGALEIRHDSGASRGFARVSNCRLGGDVWPFTVRRFGEVVLHNCRIFSDSSNVTRNHIRVFQDPNATNEFTRVTLLGCSLWFEAYVINDIAGCTLDPGSTGSLIEITFIGCSISNLGSGAAYIDPSGKADQVKLRYSNLILSGWTEMMPQRPAAETDVKVLMADRYMGAGPALTTADVTLSAEWGTGPTVSVSGTDLRGAVTVTAGTAPKANPTITITFKGGAFPAAPFAVVKRKDSTAPYEEPTWTTSTTQLVIAFPATPVAGSTYTFSWVVIG